MKDVRLKLRLALRALHVFCRQPGRGSCQLVWPSSARMATPTMSACETACVNGSMPWDADFHRPVEGLMRHRNISPRLLVEQFKNGVSPTCAQSPVHLFDSIRLIDRPLLLHSFCGVFQGVIQQAWDRFSWR